MKTFPAIFTIVSSLLAASSAQAQISLDLSKSFVYASTSADTIGATHVKVADIGNYDALFKFNPASLAFELESATPSQTDANTESLTGIFTCRLYNGTTPMFTTTIKPAGHDLIFGAVLQYRFLGTTGSNVWKYTVTFDDGGKYLLSMLKESASAVTAVQGYLAPGQTELDLANTLKCEKIE